LAVPVHSCFTDELVATEIRVSDETLERVKRQGRAAAREAAERIAENLEAVLLAEASKPPVDLAPGVRPKRRRSREEVLVGIVGAKASREARRQASQEARWIA